MTDRDWIIARHLERLRDVERELVKVRQELEKALESVPLLHASHLPCAGDGPTWAGVTDDPPSKTL